MEDTKIAFIGAGNMAGSIIGGLIQNNIKPNNIWASNPHQDKLDLLRQRFAIQTATDNKVAAEQADVLVLAVKPQKLKDVALELAPIIGNKPMLVMSVAVGVRNQQITSWLGRCSLVRVMPNTPSIIGKGASGLYANEQVTDAQRDIAESIMRAVGVCLWVDNEDLMDVVGALSASGPAYFFLIIEAMRDAAQQLGLTEETANLLAQQTALGASAMALESEQDVVDLRQQVTSPGGTTEQAIATLEQGNIRQLFLKALTAAKNRAEELNQ